jgi:stearoyl-CoA desaturase (delta-9 desaturase)
MLLPNWPWLDAVLNWLSYGLFDLSGWQVLACTLVLTHITIASVTIYLHRHSAHRSLDLHPIPAHFFRFWLWLTTAQVTKEWTAIHRKHHAKCEQAEDPHSPHVHGIKTVLLTGAELYRKEAENLETLERFGHGTPNDWLERHVYTPRSVWGVSLMLIIDLAVFGALGLTVWAVQMMWIPVTAAGIINGAGHYWGYRNFEAPDASTNISPWGIIIGGEELHNNHHTYPTSAKLSVKPYEFDLGWVYIRILETLGLATVKKTPPKMAYGDIQPVADDKTLEALIANRYEVMANYAKQVRVALKQELAQMSSNLPSPSALAAAKRWMHRDAEKVPSKVMAQLAEARAALPDVDTMVQMREELRQLWLNTNLNRAQLVEGLQTWCKRAEASGIAALQEFSKHLRAARA